MCQVTRSQSYIKAKAPGVSGMLEFGYQMRSGHVFENQRSLHATRMYTLGFHEATVCSNVEADIGFPHHPSLKSPSGACQRLIKSLKYPQHKKKSTHNPEKKQKERQPPHP